MLQSVSTVATVSDAPKQRRSSAASASSLRAPGRRSGSTAISMLRNKSASSASDASCRDERRRMVKLGRRELVRRKEENVTRSEEHTSELQSLMRNSYAVFCLTKKINTTKYNNSL